MVFSWETEFGETYIYSRFVAIPGEVVYFLGTCCYVVYTAVLFHRLGCCNVWSFRPSFIGYDLYSIDLSRIFSMLKYSNGRRYYYSFQSGQKIW